MADAAITLAGRRGAPALLALIATVAPLVDALVQRALMPESDSNMPEARIVIRCGTPLAHGEAAVKQVETVPARGNARLMCEQPGGQPLERHAGTRPGRSMSSGENGQHVATVSADLPRAFRREKAVWTESGIANREVGQAFASRPVHRCPRRVSHGRSNQGIRAGRAVGALSEDMIGIKARSVVSR